MSENKSDKQMVLIGVAILLVLGIGGASYVYKNTTTLSKEQADLLNGLKEDEAKRQDDYSQVLGYDSTQNDETSIETSPISEPEQPADNSGNITGMTTQEKTQLTKPAMQIDTKKQYIATLKTSEGDIKIKLYADKTPITVNNFVSLSKSKFYDETIFHRVINGFMIQGGDPLGNGTGGPGYKFDDEKFDGEYKRGIIAMANAGPNTNGSQFFIMHKDNALPKNYVIFGEVIEGLDVVDKIATVETTYGGGMGEKSTPVKPVKINEALIEEN